jgi:hypothetical protein
MSTTANSITLFGKEQPFRFGVKFKREFMNYYKLKKLSDFQKKIAIIDAETLESEEVISVFILSALRAASKKPVNIDPDDILDHLAKVGIEVLTPMFDAFKADIPEPEENPNAVGKSDQAQ